MKPVLTQLVFECDDPARLATFWQQVLDLAPAEGTPEWLSLRWEPVGRFSFHAVDGYAKPVWPGEAGRQQVHFDLLVDDLPAASAQVERAGGTPLTAVMDPGPKAWRVYADPQATPSAWSRSPSDALSRCRRCGTAPVLACSGSTCPTSVIARPQREHTAMTKGSRSSGPMAPAVASRRPAGEIGMKDTT